MCCRAVFWAKMIKFSQVCPIHGKDHIEVFEIACVHLPRTKRRQVVTTSGGRFNRRAIWWITDVTVAGASAVNFQMRRHPTQNGFGCQ